VVKCLCSDDVCAIFDDMSMKYVVVRLCSVSFFLQMVGIPDASMKRLSWYMIFILSSLHFCISFRRRLAAACFLILMELNSVEEVESV